MSPGSFTELEFQQQIKLLYEQGNFVVSIRYYGYKINLYLLRNFFVEVFYNHKLDQIEKVEILDTSNKRMKFYMDQIKLPSSFHKN